MISKHNPQPKFVTLLRLVVNRDKHEQSYSWIS